MNKNQYLDGLSEEDQKAAQEIIQQNRKRIGRPPGARNKNQTPSSIQRFYEQKLLSLFKEEEDGRKFIKYFHSIAEDFGQDDQDIIFDIVDSYKNLVPYWDITIAYNLVDLASLEIQRRNYVKEIQKQKSVKRTDTENISRLVIAIENQKKTIGLDAKNLRAAGEGSMSETFLECVEKIREEKKNSILMKDGKAFNFKPVFGYWMRKTEEEKLRDAQFDDADENSLERFLAHAEAD